MGIHSLYSFKTLLVLGALVFAPLAMSFHSYMPDVKKDFESQRKSAAALCESGKTSTVEIRRTVGTEIVNCGGKTS